MIQPQQLMTLAGQPAVQAWQLAVSTTPTTISSIVTALYKQSHAAYQTEVENVIVAHAAAQDAILAEAVRASI